MKTIPLTQGKSAVVDDEDYDFLMQWKWRYQKGYAVRDIRKKQLYMHRVILNTPLGFDTDHINLNRLDNRKSNLRIATRFENNCNRKLRSDNDSGFKGVCWAVNRAKWRAYIFHKGKHFHLGYFENVKDAANAYNEAAKSRFGEFARLNVV